MNNENKTDDMTSWRQLGYAVGGVAASILLCAVMAKIICWGVNAPWSWKTTWAVWAVTCLVRFATSRRK